MGAMADYLSIAQVSFGGDQVDFAWWTEGAPHTLG